MKLGLLSDTHGHHERTVEALRQLTPHGVDQLVHCGDVGSDLVLDVLFEHQEQGVPVHVVPGNVDEWEPGILLYARKLGFPFHRTHRFEADGLRCAIHHGHDPKQMHALLSDPDLDILFTGHTHVAQDKKMGSVRVINPGAVFRATAPSVAVLDLAPPQRLEFLHL